MNARRRQRLVATIAACLVATALSVWPTLGKQPSATNGPGSSVAEGSAVIDPILEVLLESAEPDELVNVVIVLTDQLDPETVGRGSRDDRQRGVVAALRAHALGAQQRLIAQLDRLQRDGLVEDYVPLWIFNAIAVTATPAAIEALATERDVARIEPEILIASGGSQAVQRPPEPNIATVGAPQVWSAGARGAGVVVGSMDTGVDRSHPDLSGRYRGGSNSWYDPYGQHPTTPTDMNGHGTGTMGVIVGGDKAGTAIGVAPDARWVAAKIFNDAGIGTSTAIHLAFQWLLDPDGNAGTADAPDVVNGSWTLGAPGCDTTFTPDLHALVAAGIVPVFAAGNFGPTAGSGAAPGNDPAAVGVGAVDGGDVVASLSSRGPSACGGGPGAFPSLTAPGIDIWTTARFKTYQVMSGTSLAAPHVSGAAALLLSADPGLSVASLRERLLTSALDLGQPSPDDDYGAGRLDAYAAYLAGGGPTPTPTPAPTPAPTATPTATPTTDSSGPLAGVPVMLPAVGNGGQPIALAVSLDDMTTGGSVVTAGEWFIDDPGPDGTGTPMTGAWNGALEIASGSIDVAVLGDLAEGVHTLFVRGRDAAGNWGPVSSAPFTIDRTPPTLSGATISPDPSQGSQTARLVATAIDSSADGTSTIIVDGEWFVGTDPGVGSGTDLAAADGAFDTATEAVEATVGLAGQPAGDRRVRLRVRDGAGNWSSVVSVAEAVTPADGIFADGFESGGIERWTSAFGSTRLVVEAAAARSGDSGLSVDVTGGSAAYLIDASPSAALSYHARVRFDPGGVVTGNAIVDIVSARSSTGSVAFRIQYRRQTRGGPEVRLVVTRPVGESPTKWVSLASGTRSLEAGWASAASSTATLWIDGAPRSLTKLDTRGLAIDEILLGPSAGLTTSLTGHLVFDSFVSSAGSTIGP